MEIPLSPELERLLAQKIKSGQYRSADEVIREGLELLEKRDANATRAASTDGVDLAALFEAIAREVPDSDWEKIPPDLSKNVDSYLYGGHRAP